MLAELDQVLKELLVREPQNGVQVSFDTPTRAWSQQRNQPTINLFLYDVRENHQVRELGWDQSRDAAGRQLTTKRKPVRVDVSYMTTCWASDPEDSHTLLWHVLRVFLSNRVIAAERFKGVKLAHDVVIEAAQPDLQSRSMAEFWSSLGNELHPAVHLVATVELDPDVPSQTLAVVLARMVRTRPIAGDGVPPDEGFWTVGGTILRGGVAFPGVQVRLLAAGGGVRQLAPSATTDSQGRYIFFRIAPHDQYHLVLEAEGALRQTSLSFGGTGPVDSSVDWDEIPPPTGHEYGR